MSPLPGSGWLWGAAGILVFSFAAPAPAAPPDAPTDPVRSTTAPPSGETADPLPGVTDPAGIEGETDGLDPEVAAAEALARELEERITRGQRASRDGRWSEAVREYSAALKIADNDPQALRGRGHAYRARTPGGACPRAAIEDILLLRVYDPRGLWLNERGNALVWMAECATGYTNERIELAEELAGLPVTSQGRPNDVRVLAARFHADAAARQKTSKGAAAQRAKALDQLVRYRSEMDRAQTRASASALRLQGDLNRELGEAKPALEAYRLLRSLYPSDELARGLDDVITELEIELQVRELESQQAGRPTPEAEQAYNQGLASLRSGNLSTARTELSRAVELSPWFPSAHYHLGQVHVRSEKLPRAIESFRKAIAMEPSDYAPHMALGLLYKKHFGGAEDAAARQELERALDLRPDLTVLHFYLGELWARDDKEKAREHFDNFIREGRTEDPMVKRAREALRDLEREGSEAGDRMVLPPSPRDLRQLPTELHRLISEAYVLGVDYGEWDRAEKTLLRAMETFPEEPALYNELAKVVSAQQRDGKAREYWERSLELDEEQMEVHERLGIMLADSELGVRHLRRAADLGSLTARYALAERLWDRLDLWSASKELDLYVRAAGRVDVDWDRAAYLRDRMDKLFFQIYLLIGLLVTVALVVPIAFVYRRVRGASLSQLLARAPKSFPEVARILSLIRHEILKHNTAFLPDVGRALELDEPDAEARATLLARRLFGDVANPESQTGRRVRERRGIYGRFLGYVQELQKVARAHGVTLNLSRKDPTFSAMLSAFEELADRAKDLRHPGGLSSRRKLELAAVLNRAGVVLGRSAFAQLSGIIEELCVSEVDDALIQDVFERVATEEQFATAHVSAISVDGESDRIRIFRTDLEDILANVFRNSLHSSVRYSAPPFSLGVDLVTETDDITGLSSLAIRVKDRSPERLTSEMLRGRYVERGMGITADLLSRYDGSITVESEPGWEKAVVLRFFTLEASPA
jgi:tetratricopeptide (TPR) repeat protein